jgi:hypothetical protein
MKQEAPQQRRSRTGIPAVHGGEHVNSLPACRLPVANRTRPLRFPHFGLWTPVAGPNESFRQDIPGVLSVSRRLPAGCANTN